MESNDPRKVCDSPIELRPMPHQVFICAQGEDWAGVQHQKERKRRQNRLNQRARRRRALAADSIQRSRTASSAEHPENPSAETRKAHAEKTRVSLSTFAKLALASYMGGSPQIEHLVSLIHLNFISSLSTNAASLGLKVDWLDCSAISSIGSPGAVSVELSTANVATRLPPTLVPTALQMQLPHHPWIDLFPLPRMRDNFLIATSRHLSECDEVRLWNDIIESISPSSDWTGLIVWGDPYDPRNWEVTIQFLRNWGWLLEGCDELFQSTNYWRRQRGESCLNFNPESSTRDT